MKLTARASALTDTEVLGFATRLQRKRISLADDYFDARVAPSNSGQGLLRFLGFGKADVALAPELTIGKLLKEWRRLDSVFSNPHAAPGRFASDEVKAAYALKNLDSHIWAADFRVFGQSVVADCPTFTSPEAWLAWRVHTAHPEHRCNNPEAGWKPELFTFAVADAQLAFDGY